MFQHNKYHKLYFKIIDRARCRILPRDVKKEVHHIIPRSLSGSDDPENLVSLTLKEHWVCHKLLVKFLVDPVAIRKMYNALFMMAVKDYRTLTGRKYELIKKNVVPWNKGLTGLYQPPLSEKSKKKLQSMWQGVPRSIEHREAMKKGWAKAKANGYQPWNKGVKGLKGPCQPVILISPDGKELSYESLKLGCKDNQLIYTKMSSVKSGKLDHYKGWKVKRLNTI